MADAPVVFGLVIGVAIGLFSEFVKQQRQADRDSETARLSESEQAGLLITVQWPVEIHQTDHDDEVAADEDQGLSAGTKRPGHLRLVCKDGVLLP